MILYKIHINFFHQVIPVNLAKEALSYIMKSRLWAASNYSSFDSFFSIALPSKHFSFAPKSIAWRFPRSPDRRRRKERIPITQTLNRRKKKKVFEKNFHLPNIGYVESQMKDLRELRRLKVIVLVFKKMSFEQLPSSFSFNLSKKEV